MKPQLVQFKTTDQLILPGLLYQPSSQTKKAAINLHGNGSASVFYSVNRTQALAQGLAEAEIAFFTFNNRGAHYIKTINQAKTKAELEQEKSTGEYQRKEKKLGTAYELIKDCQHDINGALKFLQEQGFKEFYLIGHSSGANKICTYDHYQPDNPVDKYILLGGGDDTGIFYEMMGADRDQFFKYLEQAREKIEQGQGWELVPKKIIEYILSYQSFYDICNPDGDYNTFPFREYGQDLNLSTKPLFRYFKEITKPSLVVYGENDEYAPDESGVKANQILKEQVSGQNNFNFDILPEADHSFHYRQKELTQLIITWLQD